MDSLPTEILVEILRFLPVIDLLSVSVACRKFNQIISSNSKFLDKFEIQFTSDNINSQWIGTRKYKRYFFDTVAGINFIHILKEIGCDIEDLIVNCFEVRLEILKQILLLSPNVRNLTVYNVTDGECHGYPVIKYNLKYLYFQGEINAFKMFSNCTAESVDVRRVNDYDFRDVEGLVDFLKHQKQLKELKLENFDSDCSLFKDDALTTVDFRLKKLKLRRFDENGENFKQFLENQKISLLELEAWTVNHDVLSLFSKFKSLKILKLCNMCSDFGPLNYIENLYLKDCHGQWTDKLKNVKNLVISQNIDDFQQIESLKSLESLKISDATIPVLKIPTVKQLVLNKVEFEGNSPFEYQNGCEIDDLKISRVKNLEWLRDFLFHKIFKMKSLIIQKSMVIEDDIEFIEEFKDGIKQLKIIDCIGMTDEAIEDDDESLDEDFSDNNTSDEDEEEEEEEIGSDESDSSGSEESSGTDSDGNDDNDRNQRRRQNDS